MTINTRAGAAIAALLIWSGAAEAAQDQTLNFAKTFGTALPPIGFVDYCRREPGDCQAGTGRTQRLAMSPDRWSLLAEVNGYVNGKISPVSDQDLYGKAEYWTLPTDAGDCEDYLLLKKKYLEGLGFPKEALLITVVLDEKSEGHAVLTVAAEEGDFILDNRRQEILRWSDTGYRFLKRQSARHPRQWVALSKAAPAAKSTAFGGTARN